MSRRQDAAGAISRADAPLYGIGAVARMTGIPVRTIRNWEQRYGVIVGTRSTGRHRLYSPEQVEHFRFIAQQLNAGLRCGEAHRALTEHLARTSPVHSQAGSKTAVNRSHAPVTFGGVPLQPYGHAAAFVQTRDETRAAIGSYVLDGLRAGEQVVYLHDHENGDEVRGWFAEADQAGDGPGHLRLIDSSKSYLRHGHFDMERVLEGFGEMAAELRRAGFRRARFVGEMGWSGGQHQGIDDLVEYEARVNYLHARQGTTGICVYPLELVSSRLLIALSSVHPVILVNGRAHISPFFVAPEEWKSVIE